MFFKGSFVGGCEIGGSLGDKYLVMYGFMGLLLIFGVVIVVNNIVVV